MTAKSIASKWRRALRNETGATFTLEQLRELTAYGALNLVVSREIEELCPAKIHPTGETHTGSTDAAMENRRSGRLPGRSEGQSYIEALAR